MPINMYFSLGGSESTIFHRVGSELMKNQSKVEGKIPPDLHVRPGQRKADKIMTECGQLGMQQTAKIWVGTHLADKSIIRSGEGGYTKVR